MKRLFFAILALLTLSTTAFAADGAATPPGNPEAATSGKKAQPVSSARLAYLADQLIAQGNLSKEPLYLLAAAALYRDSVISKDSKAGSAALQRIVDRAVELANGSDNIARMGDDIVNTLSRGIKASVNEMRGQLDAGKRIAYVAEFEGGSDTSVSLVLDPQTELQLNRQGIDLDLFVRDDQGRDICAMQGPGIPEYCTWTPRKAGKFQIELVNVGKNDAPFVLYFDK